MSTKTEQSMSMLGVMTLAAVFGAAAALLLAPRKGSETRQHIKSKLQDAKAASADTISKARRNAERLKSKSDEAGVELKDAVTEARSQVEDAVVETKPRSRRTPPAATPPVL